MTQAFYKIHAYIESLLARVGDTKETIYTLVTENHFTILKKIE